jgi:ornithine cyclodeaminase/alanine dehydrogenase-like protein (mu-crystallin family)
MRIIDRLAVENAASLSEWTEAMEQAILKSLSEDVMVPQRSHLDKGDDTFLIMPCIDDRYWSTKLVSFCPGNREKDLPSIFGTVVLNSSVTGEPLAIIDGTTLTTYRTAAVSALGIKYLTDENIHSLGIIGTGIQGIRQAVFACSVRPIKKIHIYDMSVTAMSGFENELKQLLPDIGIRKMNNPAGVCVESSVIITATNSKYPVFPENPDLFLNKTFIGIGSYKPEYREYPDTFFRCTGQIFTDTLQGLSESGDLIYPLQMNLIKREKIYSLGSLIKKDISLSGDKTRFFKTVGSAIFDLYAARLVYEKSIPGSFE